MMTSRVLPEEQEVRQNLPVNMRAIVYRDYGGPEVLELAETKTPFPDPKKVIIRVEAAGVNPIDYRLRAGQARYVLPGGFPRIPGYDVAGTIVFAPGESGFYPGDRVMAFLDNKYGGGYAEYARCRSNSVAKIPEDMSIEHAAAIPLAATTALQSLRDHGKLKAKDRVLINGASGGVGAFAVQIAKAYGALVTGVASGANESFVMSLGADEFIDYEKVDFTRAGQAWDLIFDAAGKSGYLKARNVMTQKGRFVSTEPNLSGAIMTILTKFSSKGGVIMLATPSRDDLRELVQLYTDEKLTVTIDHLFPLAQASDAHKRIEKGVDRGKIVLTTK
ncbi:NAD(P)-dependent alcohol dehydrogenase [Novipirellula aureliae]|nr:NAD(P)-dependent alcohol dehydrogenase [Novipirellula aureliae]